MRTVLIWMVAGLLLGSVGGWTGEEPELDPSVVTAAGSVQELQFLVDELVGWEEAARGSNDVVRADCLRAKLDSARGLVGLAQRAQEQLTVDLEDEATESAQEQVHTIRLLCERARDLRLAATACGSQLRQPDPVRPAKPSRPTQAFVPATPPAWKQPRPAAQRDAAHCLRQRDLACLVAQAAGLNVNAVADKSCVLQLSHRGVAPLPDWAPEDCTTLDHFVVVLSQLVGLTVDDPADPRQHLAALRRFGLPVDTELPARPDRGDPPLLVADEVRRMLATGLAARLPSAIELQPH